MYHGNGVKMARPIADALKKKPLFDGPLITYRTSFRSHLSKSLSTGRMQTELVTNMIKSLSRTFSWSLIDAGVRPAIEKHVKERIKK